MKKECKSCKYNKKEAFIGHYVDYSCNNENSEMYGLSTMDDDTCEEWESKGEDE